MAVLLDTSAIAPRDRIAAIHAAMTDATVPHTITHEDPHGDVHARMDYWQLGAANLFRHESSGICHTRTPSQLKIAAPERIALIVHQGGPGTCIQNGHQLRLQSGQMYLTDLTAAYTLTRNGDGVARVFQADHDQLGLPVEVIRKAAGQLPASPLYDLLRRHIPQLCRTVAQLPAGPELTMTGNATAELIRALIATAAHSDAHCRQALADTLLTRITSYIRQHLTEPDLSPERIARDHHISARHLYSTWSDADLSLGQWIITERLEGAHRELADQRTRNKTISAVARGWGFADATHFSRRFRDAYGMSPREWRQLNQPPSR
jgi:AraC-like DNA-binding protein